MRHPRRLAGPGLIVWSGLITLLAYGVALRLPFFFDDFVHIPFVDTHSLTEIWQTAGGLAYYRPLAFTLWKVMSLVQGAHDPVAQHALNLLVHWGNGLMVGWLAGRLWAAHDSGAVDWRRRYLSATLFLLFPFSYQAVPWAGSLAHPLVTALVLFSLISYLKWRVTSRPAWAWLSLIAAGLAPFAHENGVLAGPLIALIEITRPRRIEPIAHGLRRAAVWSIPALLWLPIWWLAPKGLAGNVALNGGETLLQNTVYFIQGLAYPLTWLGGWLRDGLGVNDLTAAAGLSGLALAVAALVYWRSRADRRSALPGLWYALASLPAILFLRFDYVINGPRLLMFASVGAAWLWADVLTRLTGRQVFGSRPVLRVVVAAGLCFALLVQNYSFISARMDLHQRGGSVIQQVAAGTNAANAVGQTAIFINLPAWLTPSQPVYALGHEGVQFLPGYAPPEAIARVNTGRPASLKVIRFDAIRSEMPYLFGLRGQAFDWPSLAQDGGWVFVTRYAPDGITIEPAGELAVSAETTEPLARFEDDLVLLAATASLDEMGLHVDLTWQVQAPPAQDVTLFVHVLDANGQLIAQADGDPLAGTYPFWQWAPGSTARDLRAIAVSGSGLSVRVGVYDRATGERFTATSAEGSPWADDAVPVPVQNLATSAR